MQDRTWSVFFYLLVKIWVLIKCQVRHVITNQVSLHNSFKSWKLQSSMIDMLILSFKNDSSSSDRFTLCKNFLKNFSWPALTSSVFTVLTEKYPSAFLSIQFCSRLLNSQVSVFQMQRMACLLKKSAEWWELASFTAGKTFSQRSSSFWACWI